MHEVVDHLPEDEQETVADTVKYGGGWYLVRYL
jgi:hypothetical protein